MILDEGVRPDNRKPNEEIRPPILRDRIPAKSTWGYRTIQERADSGFYQLLYTCTLSEAQDLDSIDIDRTTKRYMHQYNFPGYSTGEPKTTS